MRRFILLLLFVAASTSSYHAQSVEPGQGQEDKALQKLSLISELQGLAARSLKLEKRMAEALAKVEIADAAWTLDEAWAKKLLREAYELTLPSESSLSRLRALPVGGPIVIGTAETRGRWAVVARLMRVARRDQSFADELMQEYGKRLGRQEQQMWYADMADQAVEGGDTEAASRYILQAIEAEPTHANSAFSILKLATRDRAAADRLTVQYFERLRVTPAAYEPRTSGRTIFSIMLLIYSQTTDLTGEGLPVPPPSALVMRAYVSYILDLLSEREKVRPGSLKTSRLTLLSVWIPLKQYAPELTGAFMELERQSRRPGEDASLPRESDLEIQREKSRERVKQSLDSDDPEPWAIGYLIHQGDFAKARKMLAKLKDGAQKSELTERVNMKEAVALTTKGDLAGAQRLAEQLNTVRAVVQTYPAIVKRCVAEKDEACASTAVSQAMRQLKRADASTPAPPPGIPASALVTSREYDPVLSALDALASAIMPINETLAWEVLDEMVTVANASALDTSQGRVGFDATTFTKLAAKDEQRARQLTHRFKDPLRQVVALAAIFKWKAGELTKNKHVLLEAAR
jgi:hypothetical protein